MILFKMIKDVLIRPSYFFERIEKQKGISKAFFYLAIISLFCVVVSMLTGFLFLKFSSDMSRIFEVYPALAQPQFTFFALFLISIVWYFVMLLFSFIIAGLLHIWILIFGGKATYAKTYQLLVYSSTPNFLLGWIPYLGSLAQLYQIILLVIGTQKLHKVSLVRAILIYAIPAFVMILLLMVGIGIVLYLVASNPTLIQQAIANQPIIG